MRTDESAHMRVKRANREEQALNPYQLSSSFGPGFRALRTETPIFLAIKVSFRVAREEKIETEILFLGFLVSF